MPVAACLLTLCCSVEQRVWSLTYTVLVFAHEYGISSLTHRSDAQVDQSLGDGVKRTG